METLTGKTRYRTLRRWPPLSSPKLVLQVEVEHRFEIVPDLGRGKRETRIELRWRDANVQDLTISEARELFCRENPR